jgi:hypothetical protein
MMIDFKSLDNKEQTLSFSRELTDLEICEISSRFYGKYLLLGTPNPTEDVELSSHGVTTETVNGEDHKTFIDFITPNYFEAYRSHLRPEAHQIFLDQAEWVFSNNPNGFKYFYKNELVALLLTIEIKDHPVLRRDVIHIGYWGYERNLVNLETARLIKQHWQGAIYRASRGNKLPISVTIDGFNKASLKYALSIGANPVYLTLIPK